MKDFQKVALRKDKINRNHKVLIQQHESIKQLKEKGKKETFDHDI